MGSGVLGGSGIQNRVSAKESFLRRDPQPVHSGQQALRVGLVAFDVGAADDQGNGVRHPQPLQNNFDGVPPLGADNCRFNPLGLQRPEQFRRTGEEDCLPPLALQRRLCEQCAELSLTGGVAVAGEHGVGVLQKIADGGPDGLPVRGGPTQLGEAVLETGDNGVSAVAQRVIKIEAYRFEHSGSSL